MRSNLHKQRLILAVIRPGQVMILSERNESKGYVLRFVEVNIRVGVKDLASRGAYQFTEDHGFQPWMNGRIMTKRSLNCVERGPPSLTRRESILSGIFLVLKLGILGEKYCKIICKRLFYDQWL